jgi:hypothetical protein
VCSAYLLVLSNDVQEGVELEVEVAAVRNGSKFPQCNVVWGSFPWTGGSGC